MQYDEHFDYTGTASVTRIAQACCTNLHKPLAMRYTVHADCTYMKSHSECNVSINYQIFMRYGRGSLGLYFLRHSSNMPYYLSRSVAFTIGMLLNFMLGASGITRPSKYARLSRINVSLCKTVFMMLVAIQYWYHQNNYKRIALHLNLLE